MTLIRRCRVVDTIDAIDAIDAALKKIGTEDSIGEEIYIRCRYKTSAAPAHTSYTG